MQTSTLPQTTADSGYRVDFGSFALAPITIPADASEHEIAERIYDVLVDDGLNDIEVRVNLPAGTFTVRDGSGVLGSGRVEDYWLTLADEIRQAANKVATLAGNDRKPVRVTLDIVVTGPGNKDLTAVELADKIADAFGAQRRTAPLSGGDKVYQVRTEIGALRVEADTYLPPEPSELEQMRARVAELEAKLAEGGAK